MTRCFILVLSILIMTSCNRETVIGDHIVPGGSSELLSDSVLFCGQDTTGIHWTVLTLFDHGDFEYFDLPYSSCLLLTQAEGRWEKVGDTLLLNRTWPQFMNVVGDEPWLKYVVRKNELHRVEDDVKLDWLSPEMRLTVCED